jgi:cell pole-organizing protein PopZ
MGNTPSQLEQQATNQANLEKQVASLTANIDRLVTSLSTTQTQSQTVLATIHEMQAAVENPLPVTSEIEEPAQEADPIIANFEKELTPEERAVFIRKVIKHLTGNFDAIVENKDNQFGKSIAEIVNKIGMILSNPKSLPYNYVI